MGEEDAAWGRDPEILLGVEKPGSIPVRNPVKGPPHLGSLLLSLSASLFPRAAQIWVRSSAASPSSWSLGAQGRLLSPPSPPAYPNSEPVSATPHRQEQTDRVESEWRTAGRTGVLREVPIVTPAFPEPVASVVYTNWASTKVTSPPPLSGLP